MGGYTRKTWRKASGQASRAGKRVIKSVEKVGRGAVNTVKNIIKNPLPVIETIALTYALGPAGYGLSAASASTIASAAVTAANGGNVRDIAISAGTAYIGQKAGGAAGDAAKSASNSRIIGQIAASSTGSSVQGTLTALGKGKSLGDALTIGAQSGVTAGLTSGAIEFISPKGGPAPVEERSTGGTLATRGDTGLTTEQEFPTGMSAASNLEKPQYYVDLPTERELLSKALAPTVYSSLFGQRNRPLSAPAPVPTGTGTGTTAQPTGPTQTASSVGSSALGQALRVGDAGAPVFGGDKEEGKKAGWNVGSLRYMGDSEA
jgi:hypothetical protein